MSINFRDYFRSPIDIIKIRYHWYKYCNSNEYAKEYSFNRLKFILNYAYDHVPYYRELFNKIGFQPKSFNDVNDLNKIPVLTKSIVIENFDKLISDEFDKLKPALMTTSGSTGTPMKFYRDFHTNAASFNLFWKVWSTGNYWHIGQKQVTIAGLTDQKWAYFPKTRILALSSFYISESNVDLFYNLIKKHKPVILRGYPSAIYLFAKLLKKYSLELKFPAIFTNSETLQEFQKSYIEDFFKCKIFDQYTHWEGIASIATCTHGSNHMLNEFGYHEILDNNNNRALPGQTGKIISTGLYNLAMPLIRYDTKDLATLSENQTCDCKSCNPIVSKIFGRIEDAFLTPEGNLVGRLDAAFKYSKHIIMSHIYQPDIYNVIVKIVPSENYSYEEDEKIIVSELKKRLGNTINIKVILVEEEDIPKTTGGKVRFAISDVPSDMKLDHL